MKGDLVEMLNRLKSKTFILGEHIEKITPESNCVVCLTDIRSVNQEDRGIIEFFDGWWWICPKCKKLMPGFDQTQCEPWYHSDTIPYYRKSRKYWLAYLEREYNIKEPV